MHPSRTRETWFLVALGGAGLVVGLLLGAPMAGLAAALLFYSVIALRNLMRLHRWLLDKEQQDIPEATGLWGEAFNEIHAMERETTQSKAHLKEMLSRFQEAASALPDGMIILTRRNQIEWANPPAQRLLGIVFPRDSGQRISNLVRDPDFNAYLDVANFSEAIPLESPAMTGHSLSVRIVPYGSSQKLMICRDITHVLRLEEMRRNFVANVSHELRSPITVLSGYLETLKDMEIKETAELRQALNTMHGQAQRMERLVVDLLALSKLETAPSQASDSTVDVPAMLAFLKESAVLLSGDNRHEITMQADADLRLRGSEEELRSVFSNLINNAVRYTPPGGHIQIAWKRYGQIAEFSVTDDGVGIAPQHIPHLTERFYRVDVDRSRETGGTGLGLAIVKHILVRHGARLKIDSQPGKGSTFICVFPEERVVVEGQIQDTSGKIQGNT